MSTEFSFNNYLDQLEKSTHAPGRLVMFDLDRTLIAGYSFHAFVFERARQGLVTTRGLAAHLRQFVEYGLQRIEFKQLLEQVAADLQGLESAVVMDFAQEVFQKHLQASLYREARQLVEAHRRLGHRLVMVTSATRFQAQPVADFLGFDDVCCTELGARGGRLTGRLRGKPCFGEGKANAGRRVARRTGQSLHDAWFYSDSADDLALLDAVGHPVAVNAQPQLAVLAYDRSWPTLTFQSRRALNVEGAIRSG
ncbi:MAG: HAD family hydrolase, partial [Pseudomonadales bacterium]